MSYATVFKELDLRLKPQDLFYRVKDTGPLIFLDSSLPSRYSRYSYLGWDPVITFTSYGLKNRVCSKSEPGYTAYQHPLRFLDSFLARYIDKESKNFYLSRKNKIRKIPWTFSLPSFKGGFMGYFSYDLKNYIEKLPQSAADHYCMPLIYLVQFRHLAAYSHRKKRWYCIKNFQKRHWPKICSAMEREAGFIEGLGQGSKDVGSSILARYREKDYGNIELQSNFSKKEYMEAVRQAKEYITAGDIYQVNLSQRFTCDAPIEPEDFYYILREVNAAPFSAFIKGDDFCVASSSPERFIFCSQDSIQTRPIKGTRPRGHNILQDYKYSRQLKHSIKDRAELNMIVDLERNDLGKFCDYGSVKVSGHAVIEMYARVIHSVSTVTGKMKNKVTVADIIKAAFPGGSITGAPKIRAMQIIDQLEPCTRGVYTGSIGYISIDGTMDLNIAIRTLIVKNNCYYFNVGGGIVADSDPESEYLETLDKGKAIENSFNFFESENLRKKDL
ncbi:MAG: aminodeoxychorismate synthase component I [Actinomycetia bacterium]|nr:aminodeoxychorismate synthase component I [Actinomycetes bacterium]